MFVYVLDAQITGDAGDYSGIQEVHATQDSALKGLESWLDPIGIDLETAMWGRSKTNHSVSNDVDPDLLGGLVLSWGINKHEVREV